MDVLRALSVVLGLVILGGTLGSALETVVLPQHGFTRIAQSVFGLAHRVMVSSIGVQRRRDARSALFAPVALVSLPLVWMMFSTIGFAFIFWGLGVGSFTTAIDVSGSSLYTLGFSKPSGIGLIWVTFIEATLGLGLVALLISYLPTIYGAFNERERGIYVLAPFAGTPPSPEGLIQRMTSSGTLDNREFWNRMVEWLVDLDQSHTSFPALTYFPTRSPGQSWVASAGAMLEASALLLSTVDGSGVRALPGPILVLTYGRAALSSVGRAVGLDLPEPAPLVGLLAIGDGEPPPISVRREEYEAVIERLGRGPGADPDAAWHRYAWLRAGYDRALCGLAGLTEALPAPMTTDRPAHVGRPRLVSHRPLRVDWSEPPPGASS